MRNAIMKRKIYRFVTIFCLSILFFSLIITAHASTESQALVTNGRVLLFNYGNPTYSKLLEANAEFAAAVTADPADQEANLFYAVTRILAFGLEAGEGTGLETVRDLLEAFGISRNDVDLVEEDSPYNEPPLTYDQYDPPETMPGGEDVRAFLADPFEALLDNSIANLDKIGSTFTTILTASEIDDDYDVEVDYGDVLLFKSALYTLKSTILIMTAYDLDIDLRELVVLGNTDILQIQRDLLTKYENLLKLRGINGADGTASLTSAKAALLNGINAYSDAFTFITTEEDDQTNDLFYFESGEDEREAGFILTQLTELKSSLTANRPAVFTTTEERWIFTDTTTTNQLVVEIEKDVTEKFVWGGYWGLNGCDFISCSGWVESFSVSGTIEVACDTGSAIFTGTINAEGTTISGTYKEYDGLGDPTGGSGSFTATRQSRETETETIDFNCIFGNNTTPVKSPLNIRAILPDFDQYNEMIPGTFQGTPVLNGIIPDLQTNYDLTREMDLQPSGEFPIPTKTINVQDGDVSDWSDIDPVFTDITGEDKYDFIGDDIAALYLAKDDTNLYVRMTLTEPPNISSPDSNGGSMHYFVQLARSRHASAWSDRYFGVKYNSDNWEVMVHQYAGYSVIGDHPTGFAQAVGNDLEWKVPLSELETPFTGYFLNAWSHWTPSSYNCSDGNHTGLRVGPLASISGTITCTAHNGTGNIFIYAYDGSNPNTANELGSAYISAPGSYEITGLPVGANVYLFARWDADDNGIKTFGDYVGMTGPIPVESGGTTGVDFSLNTLIDDSFIMTKLGVYRVFGSNNFLSDVYGGFFDIDWGYDWTFIGEGNSTQTFTSNMYYEKILIIWDGETKFNFDSFEDQTANTAFAVDEYGDSTGYSWSTSNLRNFDSSDSSYYGEPSYFKGHSDGLYAVTDDWYGYSLFTMPGDTKDNSTSRQLKITLISTLTGDLNGDTKVNLADAILALKVVAGLNPTGINSSADVNGDGKIGLAEVIYILQHVVGLRDGGQGAGAEYTASGTYAYDSGAASLTLNTTSSDFVCEGPEAEVPETFTVITLTATTMVWEESDGHQMTWTRDTGTSGEIVGTWAQYDEPNSWELMVNSDSSFVVVGYIVECGYEDYVSIDGNVFEGEGYLADHTNPVQGAVVSTSLDSQTAITDANGHFFLQTNTPAEYSSTPYTITISASGYQTYSGTWTWGDHPVGQEFCLSSLR